MRDITEILVSTVTNRGAKPRIKVHTVMDFFNSEGRAIYIPDYQRPYSWEDIQRNKLLKDLENACKEDERWFLGPIYTTSADPDSNSVDLLDGQQRMTTITIILREILAFRARTCSNEIWSNDDFKRDWSFLETRCSSAIGNLCSSRSGTPKFYTDLSVRTEFAEWITAALNLNNETDYERALFQPTERWQLTSKRIIGAIQNVTEWIDAVVQIEPSHSNELVGHIHLKNYIEHLLDGLWLIEIPFNSDDDILKVFEAMNNRGLGLSLSDKMRFKTISKTGNGLERETISKTWGDIYQACEHLESNSLFTGGVDEFLEVYLVMKGAQKGTSDITSAEQREELIDLLIAESSPQDVMDEVLKITSFYEEFLLDGAKRAINELKNLQRQSRIIGWSPDKLNSLRCLAIVSRGMMKMSLNFRIFLHQLGTKYDLSTSSFILANDVWAGVRIFYQEVVIFNSTSNTVRSRMRDCVRQVETGNLTQHVQLGEDGKGWNYRNKWNLFIQNDDKESFASLVLFQWFDDKAMLLEMNDQSIQGVGTHLEHVCPKKWTTYWTDNWASEIDEIQNSEGVWWEKVLYEDEVAPTKTGKHKSTLIECIGNKAILRAASNIRVGNKNWTDKKALFQSENVNLYPNWREVEENRISGSLNSQNETNTDIYWGQFENWNTGIIVQNARLFIDTLERNWTNAWDE